MAPLLRAAVDYAGQHGARIVEGYPWEQSEARRPPGTEGFMGFAQAFRRAGSKEARRVSDQRLIMRCLVGGRKRVDFSEESPPSQDVDRGGPAWG